MHCIAGPARQGQTGLAMGKERKVSLGCTGRWQYYCLFAGARQERVDRTWETQRHVQSLARVLWRYSRAGPC